MTTKKKATKKAPAKKATAKKAAAKKAPAKKAPGKKAAAKKAPAKKAPAKKAPAKKAPAKKAAAKKAPAKKVAAKKTAVKKAPVNKTATNGAKSGSSVKAAANAAPRDGQRSPSSPAKPSSAAKKASTTTTVSKPKTASVPKESAHILDKKWLAQQRALLLEERANYTTSADRLAAEAAALMDDREPGDVQFDEESGEGDTIAVERDRGLALSAAARQSVDEIDAALLRLDNNTYGRCTAGDDIIPKDRLEAIPEAAVCVKHKTSMF